MNRNVLIVLAGGVLVAVLVAVVMGAILGGDKKKTTQVVQQAPRVEVLVAKTPIAEAQKLTEENMMWKKWPQDGTFPGTIKRKDGQGVLEAIEGRVSRAVAQGEPILKNAVVAADSTYVAASLKEGMRAVAIKVTATSTAGGFVGPGDYVDVILTYRQKIEGVSSDPAIKARQEQVISENVDSYATETVLQNVKVLAVDQSAVRGDEKKAVVAKTVTLEVTPRQAEILSVTSKAGDLSLTLRGIGDDVIVKTDEPIVTDERVTRLYDEIIEKFNKGKGDAQSMEGVKIYSGGTMESVAVQ